ncbi:sugar-binding transcriptional regulator [Roseibium aggregatum]|uniref:Sugar-binding transcriptional regulator n=1 Tax=Roseibium aggregatum TaxID=187304 RepID=A0A939EFJ2_9HYPH|nr:sugar-binding transcriptional regulator [Roseibium aggregatum]MBN9671944.1 sugar-binding transcriptional regulator [Roseibium aggregatum]
MKQKTSAEVSRLDDAARAGWLYYVAGNTQDEIARKLGVSRQSAQRLVSLAVSERLIKVRLDHPIAHCMELSSLIVERFGLKSCEVVPSDPDAPGSPIGIAQAAAAEMERQFRSQQPKIIAYGTGRTLRASVDQLPAMDCPQHRIVSLLGNMMSDGSASAYNVIIRLADRINARHYPMPLPVFARSREELQLLHNQEAVHNILDLIRQADATFVGIGNMGPSAPLAVDGFVSLDEMRAMENAGAVGEITSWVYDRNGALIDGHTNDLVASAPLLPAGEKPVYGVAAGDIKVPAMLGALKGKFINCLITNESTAEQLLKA